MNDKRDRECESFFYFFFFCWENEWKLYLLKHECEKENNKFCYQNIEIGNYKVRRVSDALSVKVDKIRKANNFHVDFGICCTINVTFNSILLIFEFL